MNPTTVFLVRHAHAQWSPDETRPLSEVGRADAERVAEILAPSRPQAMDRARLVWETVQIKRGGQTVVVSTHGNMFVPLLHLWDPTMGSIVESIQLRITSDRGSGRVWNRAVAGTCGVV